MSGKIFSFPLRTELMVLPADDQKARTIGFSVTEHVGVGAYNSRGVTKMSKTWNPFLTFLLAGETTLGNGGEVFGLAFYEGPKGASLYLRMNPVRGEQGGKLKLHVGDYSMEEKKVVAFQETADQLREAERSYGLEWEAFLREVERLHPAAEVMFT